MTTGSIAPVKQIFRAPLQIYDIPAGKYKPVELYIHSPKSEKGSWHDLMWEVQGMGLGLRLAYSSEWFRGRQYLEKNHPEAEKDFITGLLEWTGTVLDFNDETLKEGITLCGDDTIANAKTILGKKQGILLPHSNSFIKDLDYKYMSLISKLYGLKDPKRELPDYAYLWVEPNGFRPVVRGGWDQLPRGDWRVDVSARYVPVGRRFAARLVSEARPENAITQKEYEDLLRRISKRPILIE